MPLYRVHIDKRMGGEVWTNRYFVFADSLADAHSMGTTIKDKERDIHSAAVEFVRVRTDDNNPATEGQFTVTELSQFGNWPSAGGQHLPLWDCVVAEFSTGLGRPSRKYLRLPIPEADNNGGTLGETYRNALHNAYIVPLALMSTHRDVDNQMFLTGSIRPTIGMRQLKRRRKKKVVAEPPVTPL